MPNAWEGARVIGRAAVRDYWSRQFAISSRVEPKDFTEEANGSITVDVHQVVHDASTGELISDSGVRHLYRLEDGLVTRMNVLESSDRQQTIRSTALPFVAANRGRPCGGALRALRRSPGVGRCPSSVEPVGPS